MNVVARMQTFLPYRSFERSARVLDTRRLGKQRVETLQILNTLAGKSKGWQNHPAVRMWKGYEAALIEYGIAICEEWRRRGYEDTCLEKLAAFRSSFPGSKQLPPWLGNRKFHHGQQAKLLRKLPEHYANHFHVSPELEFEWPVPLVATRTKTASLPSGTQRAQARCSPAS